MVCSILTIVFVFLLLSITTTPTLGHKHHDDDYDNFFRTCQPKRCSNGGPEVRFPLRLNSTPTSCSSQSLTPLSCSGNQTVLTLPASSATYAVSSIDYNHSTITVNPFSSHNPACPLSNLSIFTTIDSDDVDGTGFHSTSFVDGSAGFYVRSVDVMLVNCSQRFTPDQADDLVGPISCLSGRDGFVYVVSPYFSLSMDILPLDCTVATAGGTIPINVTDFDFDLRDLVDAYNGGWALTLGWLAPEIGNQCEVCERAGGSCGFIGEGNRTLCSNSRHHGSDIMLITGTSIGGLFVVSVALIVFYILRKSNSDKEAHLKVEKFLAMYKTTKPTRYTYSHIKRITKGFKLKLGQGGFGSVYKGELPNGITVAVKMLEKSRGEGEEFVNEVATIGGIHHVNVVRLLGFCSEETRYALVYEFLPNESLEKFIFSKEPERDYRPLSMEKLQEIALGIAQGIEYLHQGCNQRILHFDIKPHNILLDHDFNPKISDFGLAKLCSREDSIVTMTAARGTMGYIAPEIYSRNFGTVSYKSDVYSFGMLVLEMVSGRRNIDPAIENQGEIYFPEWAYNRLIHGQDLGLAMEIMGEEEEIAKKLVIVALWCIQWNPVDRPSMTKVVEMLIGNLQSLQLPPKPFVSSSDQDNGASLNVI